VKAAQDVGALVVVVDAMEVGTAHRDGVVGGNRVAADVREVVFDLLDALHRGRALDDIDIALGDARIHLRDAVRGLQQLREVADLDDVARAYARLRAGAAGRCGLSCRGLVVGVGAHG